MKRTENNQPKELFKQRKTNVSNRRGIRELHHDSLAHAWNFFSNMPMNLLKKHLAGNPNLYASGYKSDTYNTKDKKEAQKEMNDTLFNAHDENGENLETTSGLFPYQIKKYRQLFHNNVKNEIEMYFPQKEDLFKSDGSINLRNYLVLNYLDFSDGEIMRYFDISRGSFIYFKSELNKVISKNELEKYAENAYKEWCKMHPKYFEATKFR